MKQLIIKNILIHKYQWFLYLLIAAIFLIMGNDLLYEVEIISAIITMNEFYYDEKANGDKLWNSLPFTRKEFVGSRYASLLLNTLFSTIIVLFIEYAIRRSIQFTFVKEVSGSILIMMLSAALCFPLFYGLRQRKVIFALLVLYILLIVGGVFVIYYGYLHLLTTGIIPEVFQDWQLFAIAFAITCFLYFTSWKLSVVLYSRRDLV